MVSGPSRYTWAPLKSARAMIRARRRGKPSLHSHNALTDATLVNHERVDKMRAITAFCNTVIVDFRFYEFERIFHVDILVGENRNCSVISVLGTASTRTRDAARCGNN